MVYCQLTEGSEELPVLVTYLSLGKAVESTTIDVLFSVSVLGCFNVLFVFIAECMQNFP